MARPSGALDLGVGVGLLGTDPGFRLMGERLGAVFPVVVVGVVADPLVQFLLNLEVVGVIGGSGRIDWRFWIVGGRRLGCGHHRPLLLIPLSPLSGGAAGTDAGADPP